jgi:hypothetical protein
MRRGQRARGREAADVLQRGVRQRRDRVEAQVAPELDPDLAADVLADRRLEAGAHHRLRQRLDARLRLPSSSPSVKRLPSITFTTPGLDQFGRRVDDAADDALGLDVRGDAAAGSTLSSPRPSWGRPACGSTTRACR